MQKIPRSLRLPFNCRSIVFGILLSLSGLFSFAIGPIACAAESGNGSAGMLLGLAKPSPGSSSFAYGLKGAYKTLPFMQTSVFYIHWSSGISSIVDTTSVNASSSTTLIGLEASKMLYGEFGLGLKVGKASTTTSVSTSNNTGTALDLNSNGSSLFLGPTFVFDHPLGGMSVGGEATYAFAFSSSVPKALIFLFAGKYLF